MRIRHSCYVNRAARAARALAEVRSELAFATLLDALATGAYTLDVTLGSATYELMPVTAMVAASIVAMVAVSLATPRPSDETLAKFFPEKP